MTTTEADAQAARMKVLRTEAALMLQDATGLRPARARAPETLWRAACNFLPLDHTSLLRDPARKAYVLLNQPYRSYKELPQHFASNRVQARLSAWPGFWWPPHTQLQVIAPLGYPLDDLMSVIDALPPVFLVDSAGVAQRLPASQSTKDAP